MINKHASRRLSFFTRSLFSQTFVLGVIPLSGIDQRHSPYHARQTKGDLQWNLLWDAGRGFENCTGPAMQCFKWIWEYIKIITGVQGKVVSASKIQAGLAGKWDKRSDYQQLYQDLRLLAAPRFRCQQLEETRQCRTSYWSDPYGV